MKRFPGPKPYSGEDENLFFGRDVEKELLTDIIRANRLTVLFGRSGYGKSSLIQAGITPNLKRNYDYSIIDVRFEGGGQKGNDLHSQLTKRITSSLKSTDLILGDLPEGGLWQLLKTLQWEAKNEGKKGLLLILDQFEEIFSYPREYPDLAKSISHLIYNNVPEKFQEALYRKMQPPRGSVPGTKSEFHLANEPAIAFLKEEFTFNILIGIRSDRLYLLEELGEVIPNVFTNRFQLQALTSRSIEPIVQKVGMAPGEFESPPLVFSQTDIERISKYLVTKDDRAFDQDAIEAFELQIICSYVEDLTLTKDKSIPVPVAGLLPENLDDAVRNYYKKIIDNEPNEKTQKRLFSDYEVLATRFLIERKLITKNNQRICLDKGSIQSLIVSDDLLSKIVETKIVRRVQNTASGLSFELSHDTLVSPILQSVANGTGNLSDLDGMVEVYFKKYEKTFEHSGLHETDFLDEGSNLLHVIGERNRVKKSDIYTAAIVQEVKPGVFVLNELFQDLVTKRKAKAKEKIPKLVKNALLAAGILLALTVFIIWSMVKRYEPELAFRIATLTPIASNFADSDALDSAKLSLMVFNDAYSKTAKTSFSATPGEKLVQQFNHLLPYAARHGVERLYVKKLIHSENQQKTAVLYGDKNPFNLDQFYTDVAEAGAEDTTRLLVVYDGSNTPPKISKVLDAEFIGNELFILKAGQIIITQGSDSIRIPAKYDRIQSITAMSDDVVAAVMIRKIEVSNDLTLGSAPLYGTALMEERHELLRVDLREHTGSKLADLHGEYKVYTQKENILVVEVPMRQGYLQMSLRVNGTVYTMNSHRPRIAVSVAGSHFPFIDENMVNIDKTGFGVPVMQPGRITKPLVSFYSIDDLVNKRKSGKSVELANRYLFYTTIEDRRLSTIRLDTVLIYDEDLKVTYQPIKGAHLYQKRVHASEGHLKSLFFTPNYFDSNPDAPDTLRLVLDGQEKLIITKSKISDAWFSSGGDRVFTFNTILNGYSISAYDLTTDWRMDVPKPLPFAYTSHNSWGSKMYFMSSDSLYEVDLNEENLRQLTNTDPTSISTWMVNTHMEDSLRNDLGNERINRVKQANDMNGWNKILDILFFDYLNPDKK